MSIVRLPRRSCDHRKLIAAIAESGLAEAEDCEVKVQFQPGTFMTTSALAQLCSWGLLRKMQGCSFRFLGEKGVLAYSSRIDLFKHLAFDYEETFERHDESGRFVPLRLLTDRGASLASAVEAVCELVQQHIEGTQEFLPALRWAVQELTDNIGNHAESPTPGVLCAQLYPKKRRIEIAICDMGRGIKASLSSRYPKIWSHGDAITKAMRPGVTRDLAAGQGNGLSGSQEIIMANGGDLNIWTGDVDLAFFRGRKKGFRPGPEFPGTGIFLSLRTNHPVDLRKTTLFDRSERSLHSVSRTPSAPTDPLLLVNEHCSHVGGREPGKHLRELLEKETHAGQPGARSVVVDFTKVGLPSSSFLDEAFGRFASQHGLETYEHLIEIRGAPEIVPGMISRVISQRLNETQDEPGTEAPEPPPHLRDLLAKICPAKSALFIGLAESTHLEQWWTGLLGRSAEDFHQLPLAPGWIDAARSAVGSLKDPLLLLPAWDNSHDLGTDLLAGHSSVASALVSIACTPIVNDRSFYLLVPTGLVSSQRDLELRKDLWRNDLLRTVVGFSNRWLQFLGVHSSFKTTLLHLASPRPHESDHAVAMIDGDKVFSAGKLPKRQGKELQGLLTVFGNKGHELGYRFVWDNPSRPLRYESHDPRLRQHEVELEAIGGTVSLGELLESSRRGPAILAVAPKGSQATNLYRIVHGREVSNITNLMLDELASFELPDSLGPESLLRPGDVLVLGIRNPAKPPQVGIVPESLKGAVAANHLHVLRFRDEAVRDLVVDYLQSDFAHRWLESEVFGAHVPLAKLHELPVPAPDSRITKLARKLSHTSAGLRRVADEFDSQRRDLFGIRSPLEQVAKGEEMSILAATLDRALGSRDDLYERIRLLFPLPLALSWRVMEQTENSRERYDAILQVFQATVDYLAAMLASSLRNEAAEMPIISKLLRAFGTPRRGPTLGDWIQLLRQAPPCNLTEALETSPFPELQVLLAENQDNSEWWSAVQEMLNRRNDNAHRRGPQSEREFQEACTGAKERLDFVYSRLAFLARYRLTYVMDCAFDELDGSRSARIKELIGDHAMIPFQEIPCDRELGRGLYFANANGTLTLCSPWMMYSECPKCGQWEVTIPEHGNRDIPSGSIYRSLRTGHLHPSGAGALGRLARFVGAEEPE